MRDFFVNCKYYERNEIRVRFTSEKIIVEFLFDYDFELKKVLKEINAIWSRTHKAWYAFFDKNKMQNILDRLSKLVKLDYSKLTKKHLPNPVSPYKKSVKQPTKKSDTRV